jgi:hypothetical protein
MYLQIFSSNIIHLKFRRRIYSSVSALASNMVAFLARCCILHQVPNSRDLNASHDAYSIPVYFSTWFEHAFTCIFLRRCSRDKVTNSRTDVYVLATFTNLSFRLVVYCTCWRMLFRSSGGLVGNIAVLSACWNCDVSLFVCVVIIQV